MKKTNIFKSLLACTLTLFAFQALAEDLKPSDFAGNYKLISKSSEDPEQVGQIKDFCAEDLEISLTDLGLKLESGIYLGTYYSEEAESGPLEIKNINKGMQKSKSKGGNGISFKTEINAKIKARILSLTMLQKNYWYHIPDGKNFNTLTATKGDNGDLELLLNRSHDAKGNDDDWTSSFKCLYKK